MATTTITPDTTAVVPANSTPPVAPEILERVLIGGDLSGLTEAQRLGYYRAVSTKVLNSWRWRRCDSGTVAVI
jgi:hypothetical protein